MKALMLTQPWATLVILGIKRFETRGWSTEYRGPLAIHAAKGWTEDDRDFADELGTYYQGLPPAAKLPRGAVLGSVYLQGCLPTEQTARWIDAGEMALGDYSRGRYAWELLAPLAFPEPIPARGMLGLWEWAPDPALVREAFARFSNPVPPMQAELFPETPIP